MSFPLRIRDCEIRLWRVAVGFTSVCCVCVALLVSVRIYSEPQSWALRYSMTSDEVRSIMQAPDVVLGEGSDFKWVYRRDERIELFFEDGCLCTVSGKGHPVNMEAAQSR